MRFRRQIAVTAIAVAVSLSGAAAYADPPTPDQLADRARVARAAAEEAKQDRVRRMQEWADRTSYGSPRAGSQLDLMAAEAASRATTRPDPRTTRPRGAKGGRPSEG